MADPSPATLADCLARAGVSLQLGEGEAEQILAASRRCADALVEERRASSSLDDEQAVSDLCRCLGPLAKMLRERDPFFSSAGVNQVRQQFWRDAVEFIFGRSDALAMFMPSCRKDSVMAGVEERLSKPFEESCLVEQQSEEQSAADAGDTREAKKRQLDGDIGEPPAKKVASVQTVGCTDGDADAQTCNLELVDLQRACKEEEVALKNRQQVQLDRAIAMEKKRMEDAIAAVERRQSEELAWLQRHQQERLRALREKQLKALFSPFLRIRGDVASHAYGFYSLKADSPFAALPVYQKHGSDTWLYAVKNQWWIGPSEGKDACEASGVARSAESQSLVAPKEVGGWQVHEEGQWQSSNLQVEELTKAVIEVVVVSLAGGELLRKSFAPYVRVDRIRRLVMQKHPGRTVQLVVRSGQLPDHQEIGSISLGLGETLQAVFQARKLRKCRHCKRGLPPGNAASLKCQACSRRYCQPCKRARFRECDECDMKYCRHCVTRVDWDTDLRLCKDCLEAHEEDESEDYMF